MIDKETWKIRAHCDKNGKINQIPHVCTITYKSIFLKKKKLSQVTVIQSTVFFIWMVAFKTHLDLTGKFN